MTDGYAEFNDADAKIRGIMAGVNGTFSGTFDATNVDVISGVNIRDGAVSSYYVFNFQTGTDTISFTIPGHPFNKVADIILPITLKGHGTEDSPGYISVYRNGVLVVRQKVSVPTHNLFWSNTYDHEEWSFQSFEFLQALRFIDFDLVGETAYTIVIEQGPILGSIYSRRSPPRGTTIRALGNVTVGFRKR